MSTPYFVPLLVCALLIVVEATAQSTMRQQDETPPLNESSGYDGHFFIQTRDGQSRLQFDGLLQARYEFTGLAEVPETPESNAVAAKYEGVFFLPRARLGVRGTLFTKKLRYRALFDMGRGRARLLDYYVDYQFHPQFRLRIGQDRKPFSRSLLTPAFKLQFVDRARMESEFAAGRGVGVLVHNNYLKAEGFEYAVGFYNQVGQSPVFDGNEYVSVPEDVQPSAVVRLGQNFGNTDGYTTSDLRESGAPALALAASASIDIDANDDNNGRLQGEVDFATKMFGFSATGAFYLSTQQTGEPYTERARPTYGFYGQMGYVVAGRVEPALRVAWTKLKEESAENLSLTSGVNVFFWDQNLKWQTDGTLYRNMSEHRNTAVQLRTQLQIAF